MSLTYMAHGEHTADVAKAHADEEYVLRFTGHEISQMQRQPTSAWVCASITLGSTGVFLNFALLLISSSVSADPEVRAGLAFFGS